LVPKGFDHATPIPVDAEGEKKPFAGGFEFDLGVEKRVTPEVIAQALSNARFSPTPIVTPIEQTEGFSKFHVIAKLADPTAASDAMGIQHAVSKACAVAGLRMPDPFPVVENTGPTVVKDLKNKAVLATLLALIAMAVYVWVRFKHVAWGLAATLCLFHDVIISLGFLVFFDWLGIIDGRIDLNSIAAFLTIVGYSINDTIVVFDRVRENLPRMKGTLKQIVNASVNETLSRTILTSLTVFMVVTVLFFVNVGHQSALEGLSFALMVGTVFGTYSSIYIASPIAMAIEAYAERRRKILAEAEGGGDSGTAGSGAKPKPPVPEGEGDSGGKRRSDKPKSPLPAT
jgi:preprotein translocase SecF subunit